MEGRPIKLPALPKPPAKEMAGPTSWSNWVIPGQVIAGAYPASIDDAETERIITLLLELGVNTFVCLQAEVSSEGHSTVTGQYKHSGVKGTVHSILPQTPVYIPPSPVYIPLR